MKGFLDKTWAKAAAFVLTLVFGVLTVLGGVGVGVLISYDVFLDGGDLLRRTMYEGSCVSSIYNADSFLRGTLANAGVLVSDGTYDYSTAESGDVTEEERAQVISDLPRVFAEEFSREAAACHLTVTVRGNGEVVGTFENFELTDGDKPLYTTQETFTYQLNTGNTAMVTIAADLLRTEGAPSYSYLLAMWLVEHTALTVFLMVLFAALANADADRLRDIMDGGSGTIAAIEASEREKTGIRTLKVGFNRVFGYYIEVSKSFMDQVPANYIRKQTLANCERYITQELKELENQVLTAKDRLTALEYQIFTSLREELGRQAARVQESASAVAAADTLCSLAAVAVQRGYCRPEISLGPEISITDGRHPVVEAMLKDTLFVPNDTALGGKDNQVAIITGPNMAGKSTYMRQVALIVLMAQMGSFVPARAARIGLVDRVFTRIGASDDLASGQSTFMVEMSEVASILKYATSRSLLILDEIGRGTSTYDGMSIARAVLEFAASPKKLGAKTLFATHYHELSTMESKLPNVKNYNIAVKKRGDQMLFLRKIVPGATDDSYGIEVAKLAGLPNSVITRAREILAELEAEGPQYTPAPKREEDDQVSLLDLSANRVRDALKAIQVETLTPIEAMNQLYQLRKMLDA